MSKAKPVHYTRRQISQGIVSIFALSSLASACGVSEQTDGKTHLTLWYWNRSMSDSLIGQVNTRFPTIALTPQKITDMDNKVRTAMAGHYGVPDIMTINDNIATFFPAEDQFVDLRTLGADDLQPHYLDWKWKLGIAPSGRMIGFPMDTGPTALFYRADQFEQLGLPTEPEEVADLIKTWDDYLQVAQQVKEATNGRTLLFDTARTIYDLMVAQSPKVYFLPDGRYIGDQPHMKKIWDTASKAAQLGLTAKVQWWTNDWNQAMANGRVISLVGASWMKQPLEEAAPSTAGNWRVTRAPGGAGNDGGSFIAVTSASKHPKAAFEVVKWLHSGHNQLIAYKELKLFPSSLDALSDPVMNQADAFYGGQNTTAVFAKAAKQVPQTYLGPYDTTPTNAFWDGITLVEMQNADAEQTWKDVQTRIQRELLR